MTFRHSAHDNCNMAVQVACEVASTAKQQLKGDSCICSSALDVDDNQVGVEILHSNPTAF